MIIASLPGLLRLPVSASLAWVLLTIACSLFLSLFLSAKLGVFVLIMAAIGWWAWEHPSSALLLLLVISPLLPLFKATQTIGNITLVKDAIILVLCARLYVVPLLKQELPYRRNILFAPLLVLAGWVTFSLLRSDSLTLGILRAREIMLYPLLYLAALYIPTTTSFRRQLINWSLITWAIITGLSMFQWFAAADSAVLRFDPARRIWIPRLSATFAHPSVFGHYLILIASFTMPWLAHRQRRQQFVAGIVMVLVVLLTYLTYSRAVWLGLTASVMTIIVSYGVVRFIDSRSWVTLLKRSAALAIIGGGVLVALLIFTPVGVFVRSAFDPTYQSNAIRLEFIARLVANTSNTSAIIGTGLGDVLVQNFRAIDLSTFDIAAGASRSVQLAKDSTLVDNQHLKTFIEMGLVGLLIYGWLYWRVGYHAWQLLRQSQHSTVEWWGATQALGTLGFLAAFIIQGFFIDIWDVFPTNLLFWLVAGLLSAHVTHSKPIQS